MLRTIYIILFGILFSIQLLSQNSYPQNDFISPLDIPIKLSGTFGELRSNHFHSGIDIKTGEIEGLKVFSIADGYISRIKVQSGGYGKALYITHPNGFVSVYCHLSRYNNGLNEYIIKQQYKNQSYTVDLYLEKDLFMVKQGEIIAYSGNSGYSGGPHLHFEIRDAVTQNIINPLLFGYQVADKNAPTINYLKIYPYGNNSVINGINKSIGFNTVRNTKTYLLKGSDTISAIGNIYFGINTVDLFNGGNNKNGIYSISLFVNDKKVYEHNVETFSFAETRFLNSLIDYKEYKTKKRRLQKTFIEPNNHLSLYNTRKNNGIVSIGPGKKYKITYEVTDIKNNTSYLNFWINGENQDNKKGTKKDSNTDTQLFSYNKKNLFKRNDVIFEVPGAALYDTLNFKYSKQEANGESYSAIHSLHFDYVPLHKWCNLSIWPESLPPELQNKAIIVKLEDDDNYYSAGGKWENGFIKTRVRELGNYTVMVDTLPPEIKPVNIKDQKSLLAQNTIKVKIKDKLSGIDSYIGSLNGEWILMEYDAKNNLLIYYFDHHLTEGENSFKLEVTDTKNNLAVYEVVLIY